MAGKPKILVVLTGKGDNPFAAHPELAECSVVHSVHRALGLLRQERFDGVYADTADLALVQQAGTLLRADHILQMLADGVVLVDPSRRILWSNAAFDRWCGGPAAGKDFYQALGTPEALRRDSLFPSAMQDGPLLACLEGRNGRYLQMHIAPVRRPDGQVDHHVGVGRDITRERQQQRKLDAIHQAGRELAAIHADELAAMSVEERVELLKTNILRFTRDVLNYDVVEIRLIDPASGRLETLLTQGIAPEGANRVLYARPEGNGITGLVAATGKSRLCRDTTTDPHYLPGAPGARSSLTVPLILEEKVIGTINVESPEPGRFAEQDQQFLEIFSKEIAAALHTLELLVAQKRTAATQSIEAISREVALPVDEILEATTALIDRYIGHDEDMAAKLRSILAGARSIKQCIQKVGETLAPAPPAEKEQDQAHPRLRGLRVLVADSDERVRRSAHSLLGRFHCVVETARDGLGALAMARVCPYDAILADIRLPDLSGHEFFRQVRLAQPSAAVILMSAYGYDPSHSIVKARQEGGLAGVLFKPFRMDQLLDVLEKLPPAAASRPAAVTV